MTNMPIGNTLGIIVSSITHFEHVQVYTDTHRAAHVGLYSEHLCFK